MRSRVRHLRLAPWLVLAVIWVSPPAAAQPEGPPRVSPMATVTQVVGVSRISITYSRPEVRGRTIWGELVPWGEVWRTGANEATRMEVSDDARINGEPLPAGSYSFFTIPGPEEWTIIFNRVADQWGAFQYDEAEDALRVRVRPRPAPFQERFQIGFPTVGADSATVALHWAEVSVPFEVAFDIRQATIRRAREFVAKATPADGRMVWNWANYFYQEDFNTAEALDWATRLVSSAPMYWTFALQARLLAREGREEAAAAAAQKALERASAEADQPGVEADSVALAREAAEWRSGGAPSG